MKKAFRILLVISACILLTAIPIGCSGNQDSETNDGQTILKFYGWGEPEEKKIFNDMVDEFMKENPDIKVIYENVPSDYEGKMNAMLAGEAPDVLYVPDGSFGRWASSGVLKSLQPYIEQDQWKTELDLESMWENALPRYRYDGSRLGQGDLYCLPKDIGPTVIYYNKNLFDKMGVSYPNAETPMSFEELLEKAQKITIQSADGTRMEQYGIGSIWWEGFIWSNGGEIVDTKTGNFTLNEPNGLESMNYIADLVNKYKVSPTPASTSSEGDDQMFQSGKVGMIIGGRWKVPTYRKLSFDWDVAPMPAGKTGKSAGWSGSVGIAMSAKTEHPDEAFRLIAFLGGKKGQEMQASTGFNIPNYKSLANTDLFLQKGQKPEHSEVFINMAEIEEPGPWDYYPNTKWWDILNQNLYKIWDGSQSAESLLGELEPRIEKSLKDENSAYFN